MADPVEISSRTRIEPDRIETAAVATDPAADFRDVAAAVGLDGHLLAEDLAELMAIPVWLETAMGTETALTPSTIGTSSLPMAGDPRLLLAMLNGLSLAELMNLPVVSSLDLRQEPGVLAGPEPSAALVVAYLRSLLAMNLSDLMTLDALDDLVLTGYGDRLNGDTPSLQLESIDRAGPQATDPDRPPSDHLAPSTPVAESIPVPVPRLFTAGNDNVVFDALVAGHYAPGSLQNALGGDDSVALPSDLAEAIEAGYDPLLAFSGGAGNDTIMAGGLADAIDGGAGIDTVSYSGSAGVVVLLQDTDSHGPHANEPAGGTGGLAAGDSYLGIENVIASQFDDYVFGSPTGGAVFLLDGDDEYDNTETQSVPDYVDGGAGNDAMWGGGGGDTLIGGSGNDRLSGESGADILSGGADNDTLGGGNGDDLLDGDAGTDRLSGNDGNDILVWRGADALLAGGAGTDTLRVAGGDLDLGSLAGVGSSLERVDLTADGGSNLLTLTAADVVSLSDTDNLTIAGTAADSLNAGTGWTDGGSDGAGNHVFTRLSGGVLATLVVNEVVTVNADITT